MIRFFLVLASVFLSGMPGIAAAQTAGDVDGLFDTGSRVNGTVRAIVPGGEGRVYVGGEFTTVRGALRNRIARLNGDGSVDPGFDPGSGANNQVETMVVQADGKVIIGGWFTGYDGTARNRIARLNADGSLDTSFNPGSGSNGVVTSLAVQNDGKVLMGGWFNNVNGTPRNRIARLNADGSLDTSFDPGTGASSGVLSVAVGTDGKVLIGGHFTTFDGAASPYLARLLPDGSVDETFDPGSGPNGVVSCTALQPDGGILIGGSFTSYDSVGRNRIARLEADGSLDAGFDPGTGANGILNSMALLGDGKVLIGGWFTGYNGTARGYVARLESGGGLDAGFDPGSGAQGIVFCVTEHADGKALIGGQFNRFDGMAFSYLARLHTDGSLDTGLVPGNGRTGGVTSIALQPDGKALIAGDFTSIDGFGRNRIARVHPDGTLDSVFDPGTGADGRIQAFAVLPDGGIVIAGDFATYDGVARERIARLHANGSLDLAFDPGLGANGLISCLALQADGKLLIGGDFTSYGGVSRARIARLNADGSIDATFDPGPGADAIVSSVVVQVDGKVVIAGDFITFNGSGIGRIVRLDADGSVDVTFDQVSVANGLVSCVLVLPDGKLLLGGDFTSYDGVGRARIARIHVDGSLDDTFAFESGGGVNGPVVTMALQADGKVLVGGGFSAVGGSARPNVARLNFDGSVDSSFDPSTGSNGPVHSLAMQQDGKVLIGGDFTVYNNSACTFLARALNSEAIQSLIPVNPGRLEWLRGGSAPELEQVTLELSGDGLSWSALGSASRIGGGWELAGLSLPKAGFLRARGRAAGGFNSGSSSFLEEVASYAFPPEISVEQPAATILTSGVGEVSFGSFALGGSSERTFTIRNLGYGDLSDIVISFAGTNAGDFTVTDSPDTTVLPGESTTFTVAFAPIVAGDKTTLLGIASNDEERSPFEIPLAGTMLKGSQSIAFTSPGPQPATASVALSATGGASGNSVVFSVSGPGELSGNTLTFTGPGSVTVTANQAGNENYNPADAVAHTFAVTAVPVSVTLTNLSHVYNGMPKTAGATTTPGGVPVQIDYGGPAPVNAGSHPVSATVTDPRYIGSAMGNLVIARATQTITFTAIGDRIATDAAGLSATGGGSGNAVTFAASAPGEVTGNSLAFLGTGSVTVTANQAGNANYEAAPGVSQVISVTAATATLSLSRLHQVADGTPRNVTVTTTPPGLGVSLLYDGDPDVPTDPGSYPVEASVDDARYEGTKIEELIVDAPSRLVAVASGTLPPSSPLGETEVSTFLMGAYEVTSSQWTAVVVWAEAEAGYDFGGVGLAPVGDHPVTEINWFDAVKWCNARTEWENAFLGSSLAPVYHLNGAVFKTGSPVLTGEISGDFGSSGYRLPTAAEWGHGARSGGPPSTYPGGNDLDLLGWYAGNSGGAGTLPAGGKTPNGLALHDLAGNAAEWTWDAPSGGGGERLVRGGSWASVQTGCELNSIDAESSVLRSDRIGFRVARSVAKALAAALDLEGGTWETGGDSLWFAQTGTTFDEEDAAESGSLSPGQSNWIETTLTGPGSVSFQWKVTGSDDLDRLHFSVDGNEVFALGGNADWEYQRFEFGEGPHVMRWAYARVTASGEARARVDAVSFEAEGEPTVTTAPAATEVSETSATLGGTVVNGGGRLVSERGVVYSELSSASLSQGTVLPAPEGGTGAFSVSATDLDEGATYYARAYATNNLGTAYGEEIAFTTGTVVNFVNDAASFEREILPGGLQRFSFSIGGPRFVSLSTVGGASLRAVLRDVSGTVIVSFEGDGDFDLEELLSAGGYVLEVSRQPDGGAVQAYTLVIDAATVASTRPDVAVGGSASQVVGRDVYEVSQLAKVVSKKGRPVSGYAIAGNRGNAPDSLTVQAGGGNRLFAVAWFAPGNETAALLTGRYRTPVLSDGSEITIRAAVKPNKKKLVKKKKGKKTRILRKKLNLTVRAVSTFAPGISDAAILQVETR